MIQGDTESLADNCKWLHERVSKILESKGTNSSYAHQDNAVDKTLVLVLLSPSRRQKQVFASNVTAMEEQLIL